MATQPEKIPSSSEQLAEFYIVEGPQKWDLCEAIFSSQPHPDPFHLKIRELGVPHVLKAEFRIWGIFKRHVPDERGGLRKGHEWTMVGQLDWYSEDRSQGRFGVFFEARYTTKSPRGGSLHEISGEKLEMFRYLLT